MKNLKAKLVISTLAFTVGVACFYLWNLWRLNPAYVPHIEALPRRVSTPEPITLKTPQADAVSTLHQGPISKVDFLNFAYPNLGGRGRIRVKNGELEREVEHCTQHYRIKSVDYLDFTGDGQHEAVVRMVDHIACGSSAASVNFYVYTMRNNRPRLLWTFVTGSESYGGPKDFHIEGKELVLELYGKWEAVGSQIKWRENRKDPMTTDCCPTHYTVYRVAWDGKKFSQKSLKVLPFTSESIY